MRSKHIKNKHNIEPSFSDTKLFKVLKEFDTYELNRLRKFVESPYFNRNETLVRLLETLNQIIRKNTGKTISRQELWSMLYTGEPFDDLRFRKLCSDLLRLTEKFLMQEVYENNSLQQADNLLVAVNNKKIKALYNGALSTAKRLSEQYFFRPASFYYHTYSLERGYFYLSGLELARSQQANIEQIGSNLDKFYIAEKLRTYIMMIDSQRIAAHDYHLPFVDEIFKYLKDGDLVQITPINFYYQIYLTRSEPENPNHFEKLKELMNKELTRLPQLEAFEVLDSALNYCISRINKGDNSYLRQYMEMSLMGIRNELLLVNGALSPWMFRNIIVTGLRLRDYQWVEEFIRDYQDKIEVNYRESAVRFNLANLYFYQKRYGEVLALLQSVEYDDPAYNRDSKSILMATYYELEEFESLSSLLSSFELYLRRNKGLPDNRKEPYLNLIRFLRLLIKLHGSDSVALQKLKGKVARTDNILNKSWLLEKIDELL